MKSTQAWVSLRLFCEQVLYLLMRELLSTQTILLLSSPRSLISLGFERRSYCISQAGLHLLSLLLQPPIVGITGMCYYSWLRCFPQMLVEMGADGIDEGRDIFWVNLRAHVSSGEQGVSEVES